MFNLDLGTPLQTDGRSCLAIEAGRKGYAVYGPYEVRRPGSYTVDFHIKLAADPGESRDRTCAVVDVTRNAGNDVLVSRSIKRSELSGDWTRFSLDFTLAERSKLEYRIWTSGALPLDMDENRQVRHRVSHLSRARVVHDLAETPPHGVDLPEFFAARYATFFDYYRKGYSISFVGEAVMMTYNDISFFVKSDDDFNFIGEVISENVYDFSLDGPVCAIDIGMNVGFTSLQFARRANVREIFSFEPFPETYGRAIDNFSLNPSVAGKIKHVCFGLSDRNWSGDVPTSSDNSGSFSVVSESGEKSTAVTLRDAASILRPIIHSARERGMRIVLKVDCEGSEFAIFRSLAGAGLFESIDAVMVEWHAMFDNLFQDDLFEPLHKAGFIIFDRSPPSGNGFFYGARLAGQA